MAKFGLGEEVVIIYDVMESKAGGRVVHPAGAEGVVEGLPGSVCFDSTVYRVMVHGDETPTYCKEYHLRRKTGSWDEIERTTGFRPSKTRRKTPEREPETVT